MTKNKSSKKTAKVNSSNGVQILWDNPIPDLKAVKYKFRYTVTRPPNPRIIDKLKALILDTKPFVTYSQRVKPNLKARERRRTKRSKLWI